MAAGPQDIVEETFADKRQRYRFALQELAMRIAIADDDETITEFIRKIVESGANHCSIFGDGQSLITQLQRDTFDLVILDWHMPKSSGMDVLNWIRSNLPVPPAIIMVTSRSDKDDITAALDAGADDYIIKPEAAPVISARISAVLRRAAPAAPPSRHLDFGRYRFDRVAMTVAFDQTVEKLTAKEFALALLFFQNLHRPLSRGYILDAVWNSVADLPTRTLDMHVSRLRTKLKLTAEHGYRLQSIFSYGYRLEAGMVTE